MHPFPDTPLHKTASTREDNIILPHAKTGQVPRTDNPSTPLPPRIERCRNHTDYHALFKHLSHLWASIDAERMTGLIIPGSNKIAASDTQTSVNSFELLPQRESVFRLVPRV